MGKFSILGLAFLALLSGCNEPEEKKDPCLNATAPEPINPTKTLNIDSNRTLTFDELFSSTGGKCVSTKKIALTGEPSTIKAQSNGPSGVTLIGQDLPLMTRLGIIAASGAAVAVNGNPVAAGETRDTVSVTATNCCGLSATSTVTVNLKPPAPTKGPSTTTMALSADGPPPSEAIVFAPPPPPIVTIGEPTGRGFGSSSHVRF